MPGDLTSALRSASSGLLANQRALDAVANNVANVNTLGYSRKTVRFESRALTGGGAGVDLGPLMRTIDEGLLRSIRTERGALGTLSVQEDYYTRISDLFGSPESDASLSHRLAEFDNAIGSLALAPHDLIEQREAVRRADEVAEALRHSTRTVQSLRADADAAIAQTVDDINGLVARLADLTATIVRDRAVGRETGDAEDQRDRALDRLAERIDIRVFARGGGGIAVLTASGRTLLDGTAAPISHDPVTLVDANTTYAGGNFDAITVGTGATARDITDEIRGGSLAGLIELRDRILPDLQSALDTLAAGLRDSLNEAHNAGLPYPGLTRLDGTRRFTEPAQQTIGFAANEDSRLVLFDSAGNEVRSTSIRALIDGASATVANLVQQIDGWLGTDGGATIVDGAVQIRVSAGGRALGIRDEAEAAPASHRQPASIAFDADADGQTDETVAGFSSFFGLNDLFVDEARIAAQASAVIATDFTASPATLTVRNAAGVLGAPVAIAAGDDLSTIAAKISAATGLETDLVPDGSGVRLRLTAPGGAAFTLTENPGAGDSLLEDLNLAPSSAGLAGRIAVRADIAAAPQLLSRGAIQWDPGQGAAGGYRTGVADKTTVDALAAAMSGSTAFPASGTLGAVETTLGGYATTILGDVAGRTSGHTALAQERGELVGSLQAKSDNLRGVNLDEEMADLMVFEQAYAASARVFGVVNDMFDTLERMLD
ncbi:MAG: flagellar hook-associated protein FlgK [Rhodospirillales bacterium]|nr:flagellar hook-associated protein FlgK [Rhodospirillales bacterium]